MGGDEENGLGHGRERGSRGDDIIHEQQMATGGGAGAKHLLSHIFVTLPRALARLRGIVLCALHQRRLNGQACDGCHATRQPVALVVATP